VIFFYTQRVCHTTNPPNPPPLPLPVEAPADVVLVPPEVLQVLDLWDFLVIRAVEARVGVSDVRGVQGARGCRGVCSLMIAGSLHKNNIKTQA
jgi:hypothetical protein